VGGGGGGHLFVAFLLQEGPLFLFLPPLLLLQGNFLKQNQRIVINLFLFSYLLDAKGRGANPLPVLLQRALVLVFLVGQQPLSIQAVSFSLLNLDPLFLNNPSVSFHDSKDFDKQVIEGDKSCEREKTQPQIKTDGKKGIFIPTTDSRRVRPPLIAARKQRNGNFLGMKRLRLAMMCFDTILLRDLSFSGVEASYPHTTQCSDRIWTIGSVQNTCLHTRKGRYEQHHGDREAQTRGILAKEVDLLSLAVEVHEQEFPRFPRRALCVLKGPDIKGWVEFPVLDLKLLQELVNRDDHLVGVLCE